MIDEFEISANSFGQAFEAGTPKRSNRIYHYCESIKSEIYGRGPLCVGRLIALLDSSQPWVRYLTAAYTVGVEPIKAASVLAELKQAPKALGVAALTTLRAWEMKQDQAK